MIYLLSDNVIVPGKMAEFHEIVSKELAPLYPKIGMKLVASWHAYTGNMNETYGLYVFNDLASYQKSVELRLQDKDYQRAAAKMNALRVGQTSTLLEPNAWSPMK